MILLVPLEVFHGKSSHIIGLSLELPLAPTDANEANSTWRATDAGQHFSIDRGYCNVSPPHHHAWPDQLWLVNRGMDTRGLDGRVVAGAFVVGIVLWEFFGFDGGIREKGNAFVSPLFG